MAVAARELGHEYLVLTDHSPRLKVARGLSAERLRRQLDVVAGLNDELAPFRLLTGIEVDILDDGSLDQTAELLARLDLVVASVHSGLRMPAAEMTPRMVAAVSNPHTDVLGHCTGRMVRGRGGRATRPESQFDAELVFAACARAGVAVEINSPPGAAGPAQAAAAPGGRGGLPVLHRHRRARPRAAGLAAHRLRARGPLRGGPGPGGEHPPARGPAGLDRRPRQPAVIVRAGGRFVSAQPGVRSWHTFSAGAHYDPARLRAGRLVGLDEHHVAPGAGFDWHAHRGVEILSWVLAGRLRHQSDGPDPVELVVRPGRLLRQQTGTGLRHRETNPGAEPLRLLQFTVLGGPDRPAVALGPVAAGPVAPLAVWRRGAPLPAGAVVTVLAGSWAVGPRASGAEPLAPGDVAWDLGEAVAPELLSGSGELLVLDPAR